MRASEALAQARSFADRRRWWILGALVVAQWAFVAREALYGSAHNGWIYQHGDDGPWYWTSAWTLTSLHVPTTAVGFGWPYLLTPLAAIFGPDMANGLPAIIALNVVILAPAAVIGMYLLGERIAGTFFGLWTAFVWVVLPGVALVLYRPKTRPSVIDSFVPTATGMNALSDFPSMVCAIFGAYLLFRALERNDVLDGALCGVVLGFLVLLKPANGPLLIAGAIVLALAFRFRALIAAGVAVIPAIVALTVWKRTGSGTVAILPPSPTGGGGPSSPTAPASHPNRVVELYHRAVTGMHQYINFNWHHLGQNLHDLREVFWSLRLLEFVLVAGSIALIARGRWKGALVVAWFVGFGLVKATSLEASVSSTSLYRLLLPAWPAWVLLTSGLVLLWPSGVGVRAQQRLADAARARAPSRPSRALLVAAVVILAAGPLVLSVAASPVAKNVVAQQNFTGAPIAIVDFHLSATRIDATTVTLRWAGLHTGRAKYGYRVFRDTGDGCATLGEGAPVCRFSSQPIGGSVVPKFTDTSATGRVVYRVELVAGWSLELTHSSAVLLSTPITVPAR